MTLKELKGKLDELGVSSDRYYLHGLYGSKDDYGILALIIKKDADNDTIKYEIYYREKGEKDILRTFFTEDEACKYIYKKFVEDIEIKKKYKGKLH